MILKASARFGFGIGISCCSLKTALWAPQPFFKEAVIWKRLSHPNIVPFLGVTKDPIQFVSEWMPNGTLTQYVNKNPSSNRITLVSSPCNRI